MSRSAKNLSPKDREARQIRAPGRRLTRHGTVWRSTGCLAREAAWGPSRPSSKAPLNEPRPNQCWRRSRPGRPSTADRATLTGLAAIAGMLADGFAALPGSLVLEDPVPVEDDRQSRQEARDRAWSEPAFEGPARSAGAAAADGTYGHGVRRRSPVPGADLARRWGAGRPRCRRHERRDRHHACGAESGRGIETLDAALATRSSSTATRKWDRSDPRNCWRGRPRASALR